MKRRGLRLVVWGLAWLLPAAMAADGPFDPHTGRDPYTYPPDPQVDFQHTRLEISFADLMSRSFDCTETIAFKTLATPRDHIDLNGIDLDIRAVRDGKGRALVYDYDGKVLGIRLADRLGPQTDGVVTIAYTCTDPERGMWFALPDEAYSDRPLNIHTQGEADYNRYWFFCHDAPNERATREVLCTVPAPYKVLSNGKLIERKDLDGNRTQWHYRIDQPIPAYLVSLVIGPFDVVRETWHDRPVEYWLPPGHRQDAARSFGKTPKMLTTYSDLLGFEYPFAKYAQSLVYLFQWGGMENASCTTLYETAIVAKDAPPDDDIEGLIAHELAHQWFGDTLTCKTWNHIWLNEGFATYMTHAWYEAEYGPDEYTYRVWSMMHGVAGHDRVGQVGGMVGPYAGVAMNIFFRPGSNPYSKGGSTLHMLRRTVGDDVFWRCMQDYVKTYAWKQPESSDLRQVFEQVSGRSLERFFRQWVYRGGVPEITVDYIYDDEAHQLRVTLTQTQTMTAADPAFVADVDVWLVDQDGRVDKHTLHVDQRVNTLAVRRAAEPAQVCVDPRASLLADYTWELPTDMLARIATDGPALGARLHAVSALAERDRKPARQALRTVLTDAKAHWGLRSQAAGALGRMQVDAARAILLDVLASPQMLADLRVRRAAIGAVGSYRDADVTRTLLRYARDGSSAHIIAAACGGLGNQDATDEVIDALLQATKKPSRDDEIEQAAVRALAALGDPRGIPAAMELARYGRPYRARPTGIRALGRLGSLLDDKREVREFLEGLLGDPQDKAAMAVAGALTRLGDPAAIDALRRFAASAARQDLRDQARDAIDNLRDKQGQPAVIRDLRERIRKLEDFRERIEEEKGAQHAGDDPD